MIFPQEEHETHSSETIAPVYKTQYMGSEGTALPVLASALDGGEWSATCPRDPHMYCIRG
jgi:hypothetical protein